MSTGRPPPIEHRLRQHWGHKVNYKFHTTLAIRLTTRMGSSRMLGKNITSNRTQILSLPVCQLAGPPPIEHRLRQHWGHKVNYKFHNKTWQHLPAGIGQQFTLCFITFEEEEKENKEEEFERLFCFICTRHGNIYQQALVNNLHCVL